MYTFGSGAMWGTPLTDSAGGAIAIPTPVLLGTLQDVSVDISFDNKVLHGTKNFGVALGRGKGKIGGKAKFARIDAITLNSLFFGQTLVSSQFADYQDIVGSVIPTTPYILTPTIPNAGVWAADLGVRNSAGGSLLRVASAPATGQYSVSAGAYTFAAADVGQAVFISFQYTAALAGAAKSTVTNMVMGDGPSFRCDLFNSFGGKALTLSLFNCFTNKLQIATKMDDFMIPEFDFDAIADSSGRVLQWGTSE